MRRLIASVLLGAAGIAGAASPREPARRATTTFELGVWAPYIDFSQPDGGVLSQVVREALGRSGIAIGLKEVSWKTAETHLDRGTAASFGWIKTGDRLKRWRYSDPICSIGNIAVVRADQPIAWTQLADLADRKIGWTRGYSYGEEFDLMKPRLQVVEMPGDAVGLKRLLTGDIDLMLMDHQVARQLLTQQLPAAEAARLKIDSAPRHALPPAEVHVTCNRASAACAQLIADVNRGLKAVRPAGSVTTCSLP